MSKGFRFELDRRGVRSLLHSSEMQGCLEAYADRVRVNAGEGYKVVRMPTRVIAVKTDTEQAFQDTMTQNTLAKALFIKGKLTQK